MEFLKIDSNYVTGILAQFLKEETEKAGFKKVVFGLSGGIDSTVVAYLCTHALSAENVTALVLPYSSSSPENIKDAENVAQSLQIEYQIIDISPMVDIFFKKESDANHIRRGNLMARERMCVIYDYSSKHDALVIGTSNKSELLLGYGTIFGDLASAINPIGDLYKTHIRQIAQFYGVPDNIINKSPSADLWLGQTDEEELGYSYDEIDRLLYYLIDLRYSDKMLVELGFLPNMIKDIKIRIQKSQFKRRPPIIAKLSNRTINQDFRYCRDWGV
jgi:NAD+ synthase